jgi:hypothetical protein
MHHVIPVFCAGDILQSRGMPATRPLHLSWVREHLDVAIHVGRKLIKRA